MFYEKLSTHLCRLIELIAKNIEHLNSFLKARFFLPP